MSTDASECSGDQVASAAGDERDAAFQRWLQAAGRSDPAAWTPTTVLCAAWKAFAGGRPASMGWFCARMRAAGVAPHRTNRAKGFRFRLADIDEIKEGIAAAALARKKAGRAHDRAALAAAVRAQMEAKRRAGALLAVGLAEPSAFGIGKPTAARWRALARLDDEEFAAEVEAATVQAIAALTMPHGVCAGIKMRLSEWETAEDGTRSRTLSAESTEE